MLHFRSSIYTLIDRFHRAESNGEMFSNGHAQVRIDLLITAKNAIFESISGLNTFWIIFREAS